MPLLLGRISALAGAKDDAAQFGQFVLTRREPGGDLLWGEQLRLQKQHGGIQVLHPREAPEEPTLGPSQLMCAT